MKKKFLALVISCALFATMLPSTVLADMEENADAQTEAEVPEAEVPETEVPEAEAAEEDGVQTLAEDAADESEPVATAWTGTTGS